jgi:hypothetical protein
VKHPDDLLTTAEVALITRAPVSTVRYWLLRRHRSKELPSRAPGALPACRRHGLAACPGGLGPSPYRELTRSRTHGEPPCHKSGGRSLWPPNSEDGQTPSQSTLPG